MTNVWSVRAALGALCACLALSALADPRFRVEIEGAPTASAAVESVRIDDIVIDAPPAEGEPGDESLFGPRDAHFGSITIRARRSPGPVTSSELYQWWLAASRGEDVRKTISVISLRRDGTEARRFNVFDAFPTRWDPGEYSPSSSAAVETIVAKMQRVELASAGPSGGGGLPGVGASDFEVSLAEPGADSANVSDRGWETCSGGALQLRAGDPAAGVSPTRDVTELRLRGPLTSGRQALCQWINEASAGLPSRRDLLLRELPRGPAEGETFTYLDCFPTRYVFPAFGVDSVDPDSDGDGIDEGERLEEEFVVEPSRLRLR